ncbi:MAG TPA: hypothetical protein DDW49_08335 [Deltaproteobacteria bacterium]|nr:MAG: hypothetical protein A2048_07950 [Deltaproteobacteria bacterium GWA2_45_12]HBF13372.1 hypothetical protein [Deltaproteobacteria bacterium]
MTEKNTSLSWTDLAKKVVTTGLGSASFARDMVLNGEFQREIVASILTKLEKRKEDVLDILAKEVSKFLGKINVSEEVAKALQGLVIHLNASIDFNKKAHGKGVTPRVQVLKAKTVKKK